MKAESDARSGEQTSTETQLLPSGKPGTYAEANPLSSFQQEAGDTSPTALLPN